MIREVRLWRCIRYRDLSMYIFIMTRMLSVNIFQMVAVACACDAVPSRFKLAFVERLRV
jgi:hypothetical protein